MQMKATVEKKGSKSVNVLSGGNTKQCPYDIRLNPAIMKTANINLSAELNISGTPANVHKIQCI